MVRSGVDLGIFPGETEADALDAMARASGYADNDHAQHLAPIGALRATDVTPTDQDIEELREEAAEGGHQVQLDYCRRALQGDVVARLQCARVIALWRGAKRAP